MVNGAVRLVIRLELDRQKIVAELQLEKDKVCVLHKSLDDKNKNRLNLLPCVVQAGKSVT